MTGLTTDPGDPRLPKGQSAGGDSEPVPQQEVYLVLSEDERRAGFVRPYRETYRHTVCGHTTTMGRAIAETYARSPRFYSGTYCVHCKMHRPLTEFLWLDGQQVGS